MEQKKVRRPLAVRSQRKPKGSGQERREEIIAAAKELFMTEGFAKVTTRPIGKDFSQPIEYQEAGARSFMRFRDHLARLAPAGLMGGLDSMFATQMLWLVGHGAVSLLTTRSHFPWADRDALIAALEDVIVNGLAATRARSG